MDNNLNENDVIDNNDRSEITRLKWEIAVINFLTVLLIAVFIAGFWFVSTKVQKIKKENDKIFKKEVNISSLYYIVKKITNTPELLEADNPEKLTQYFIDNRENGLYFLKTAAIYRSRPDFISIDMDDVVTSPEDNKFPKNYKQMKVLYAFVKSKNCSVKTRNCSVIYYVKEGCYTTAIAGGFYDSNGKTKFIRYVTEDGKYQYIYKDSECE